ncbi:MAG TPA: hypothetical protein VFN29_03335 [Chiayiivirga sp.]|nr:hypothetical protein [Chiayiivirga sp.]
MKSLQTAPIRIELAPSRSLRAAILVLAGLALLAIWFSRVPSGVMILVPLLAWHGWYALARDLPLCLVLRADGSAMRLLDGDIEQPVQLMALHERGGIGVLVLAVDARVQRLAWAPDTLSRPARRELRLWLAEQRRRAVAKVAATTSSENRVSRG